MQRNNSRDNSPNMGLYIFECAMSLLYLTMSYIFLFTQIFGDAVSDKNIRLMMGALLGIYGIFRVYRAIKKFMKNKQTDE